MTTSYTRFGQGRVRQQWAALAAVLVLILCCPQQGAAATINVNTTRQGVVADPNQCSLQEAIYASEFKSNTAISQTDPDVTYNTGCTAGTGDDIIVLTPGALYTFNQFWDGDGHNIYGPTATPIIFSKITIEGNGATLQWQDIGPVPGNSRLFAIGTVNDAGFPSGTGGLTLKNVYVKDFHIQGGDGGTGGGGGLGAGGAIFNAGSLTVENSTFENNGALGGQGGGSALFLGAGGVAGGGGGGLFGSGGEGCFLSGGGGGGSRGDGGRGTLSACDFPSEPGGGGGGGGTVFSGGDGQREDAGGHGGASGLRCGGNGGDYTNDGHDAACDGGGGGGAGTPNTIACWLLVGACFQAGGTGHFGGGGGGGGVGDGGDGGFGGGGGGGDNGFFSVSGGTGGFGGGGGAVAGYTIFTYPGEGLVFGGHADDDGHGGGGGALGGAIFNFIGSLSVSNSTFFNNFVARGEGGGGSAANGADAGGAIFSLDSQTEINNCTFSGNQSTGSGAAIVAYS